MKNSGHVPKVTSFTIEEQLLCVSTEVARRVLSSSRQVFSIIEWSPGEVDFLYPWSSSQNEDEHLRLLDSISARLTSRGTWCMIEGTSNSIRAELYNGKSASSKSETSVTTQLSQELGRLISDGDEAGVCRLIAILSNEFPWVGFSVRNIDPLCVATLLRHCEHAFAAIDARSQHSKQLRQSLKDWRTARIPLGSAFLVGAA